MRPAVSGILAPHAVNLALRVVNPAIPLACAKTGHSSPLCRQFQGIAYQYAGIGEPFRMLGTKTSAAENQVAFAKEIFHVHSPMGWKDSIPAACLNHASPSVKIGCQGIRNSD